MGEPAQETTFEDKCLSENIGPPRFRDEQGVVSKVTPGEKIDPTSMKVAPRWWSTNPESVAIGKRDKGKKDRDRVAN